VPSDILPYAADVGEALPEAELNVLRQQYDDESTKGHLSVQTRFNLAWWARFHLLCACAS
jgi:fission 1 protein